MNIARCQLMRHEKKRIWIYELQKLGHVFFRKIEVTIYHYFTVTLKRREIRQTLIKNIYIF